MVEIAPTLSELRPSSANIAQHLGDIGPTWPIPSQMLPKPCNTCPSSVEIGPSLAESGSNLGPISVDVLPIRPNSDQSCHGLDQIWLVSVETAPDSIEFGAESSMPFFERILLNLARAPGLGHIWSDFGWLRTDFGESCRDSEQIGAIQGGGTTSTRQRILNNIAYTYEHSTTWNVQPIHHPISQVLGRSQTSFCRNYPESVEVNASNLIEMAWLRSDTGHLWLKWPEFGRNHS